MQWQSDSPSSSLTHERAGVADTRPSVDWAMAQVVEKWISGKHRRGDADSRHQAAFKSTTPLYQDRISWPDDGESYASVENRVRV